jgi:3-phosphoshikimate 1-carboxyvinyltransferase
MQLDLPDPCPIEPLSGPVDVTITPPGSKSLTCRAYVLAALADGESTLVRPLRADDTDHLLAALLTLGATATWQGGTVRIRGVGGRFPSGGRVDLGEGGAPARFLIAAAALAAEPVVIDGSPRLRERPIAELVDLLTALGAHVEFVERDGCLPVCVHPAEIVGGRLEVGRLRSSQFVSALLLIGPHLREGLELIHTNHLTSPGYVDLTLGVLREWGVEADRHTEAGLVVHSVAPLSTGGRRFRIEPDASSATYWLTAGAIAPLGSRVCVEGIDCGSLQPDSRYGPEALVPMGAAVHSGGGSTTVEAQRPLRGGVTVDLENMPDAAMSLAAAAAVSERPTTITGLHTLPVKESDRIVALATELGRVGCATTATADSLSIDPAAGSPAVPVTVETYRDHRMAMAFAVLGLARGGIAIRNPACVSKSYPGFWTDLARFRAVPA